MYDSCLDHHNVFVHCKSFFDMDPLRRSQHFPGFIRKRDRFHGDIWSWARLFRCSSFDRVRFKHRNNWGSQVRGARDWLLWLGLFRWIGWHLKSTFELSPLLWLRARLGGGTRYQGLSTEGVTNRRAGNIQEKVQVHWPFQPQDLGGLQLTKGLAACHTIQDVRGAWLLWEWRKHSQMAQTKICRAFIQWDHFWAGSVWWKCNSWIVQIHLHSS